MSANGRGSSNGRAGRKVVLAAGACFALAAAGPAAAGDSGWRIGAHGLYAAAGNHRRLDFSQGGPGLGLYLACAPVRPLNRLGIAAGFDYFNLLSREEKLTDPDTGLRIERRTSQGSTRFYLGSIWRLGVLGPFRPYFNGSIALVNYGISTELVIPDSSSSDNDIHQKIGSENFLKFGYGLGGGINVRMRGSWALKAGVRWTATSKITQQLGAGARKVHPEYYQIHLGVEWRLPRRDG